MKVSDFICVCLHVWMCIVVNGQQSFFFTEIVGVCMQ